MVSSAASEDVSALAEGGFLGYARSPHPGILLKIAIAWNDGRSTIGWVAGLYTREAFNFLKSIHEKIAASTLADCDAQDFHRAFKQEAAHAYLALPPAFYHVAFSFIEPPAVPLLFSSALMNSGQALGLTLQWQIWRRVTTRPRNQVWHHLSQNALAGC